MKWKYTRENPCKTCYGWNQYFSSNRTHKKFVCPECERQQCLLHWPYPMKTEEEAIHFLKSAELRTGKKCFARQVQIGGFEKWKIFTSGKIIVTISKPENTKDSVNISAHVEHVSICPSSMSGFSPAFTIVL